VTARRTDTVVPLRVTLVDPPEGVAWALQIGAKGLAPPSRVTGRRVSFDLEVRVGPNSESGAPRLLGPAVQGPPAARFLYLNSGLSAGQAGSCWDRRAKVPLTGITSRLIDAATAGREVVLEAEVAGTGRDGGPACASVPLLGAGWRLA
jgi:hypothetical protein